jgi:hypothetical protein
MAAFGHPMPSIAWQSAPSGRPAHSHRAVRVQRMCRGTVLTGASVAKRRQGLHLDLLHGTSYKPQHRDLGEGVRRDVLTGEVVGVAAANGFEGENFG